MMMADRSADRELSYETTTSSHHGSESDLLSSSSRPDTAGSSSSHLDPYDPLTPQDPTWTVHHDLLLLSLIVTHRPVGPHKHFRILAIQHAMERGLPRLQGSPHELCRVSVASIWARLRELYDLDALEKVDTCPDEWPALTAPSSLASTPATTPSAPAPLLLSANGDPLSPSAASISRRSARLRASTTTNSSSSSLPSRTSIATDDLPAWDPAETFSVPLEWMPASVVPPPQSPVHSPLGLAAASGGGASSSSSLSGSGSNSSSSVGGGRRGKQLVEVLPKRPRGRPKGSGVKQRQAMQVHQSEEDEGDGGNGSQEEEGGQDEDQDDDVEGRADEDLDPMDVDRDSSDKQHDNNNVDHSDNDAASSSSSSDHSTPQKPPSTAPVRRGRPPKNPPPPPEPQPDPPKKRRGRPPKIRPPPPPEPDSPSSPSSASSSSSSSSSSSDLDDDPRPSSALHTPTYPPALDPLGLEDGMVKVEEGPVGRRTRRAVAAHTEGSSAPSTAPVSPTGRVLAPAMSVLAGLGDMVAGGGGSGGSKRARSPSPPVMARKGRRVSGSSVGESREGSSSPPPAAGGRRKTRRSLQGEQHAESGSAASKRRMGTRRG